ncbi:MAG: DNA polymerase I [Clostridiales bacterium]|jgi:DNA polymerase-1|nr:DNA polymerase I [Clostridiales bacterium]
MDNKRMVIIDSNSLLNRAFYALPLSLKTKAGAFVNAVFGYVNMLSKIISDLAPTHIAAAFDMRKPTFRHERYAEYKGTRKPMPDELAAQMPIIRDVLKSMDINPLEKEGFEADDLIGTLAKSFDGRVYIVTGDRDLLQIVDDNISVLMTIKGVSEVVEYDPAKLKEQGLTPKNIIDLKALMGDQSDNIPGVAGIGEKTAQKLVAEFGTIEELYDRIGELSGKQRELLEKGKDGAFLSKELATIDINSPIDCGEECYVFKYPFSHKAKEKLLSLDMKTPVAKLQFAGDTDEKTPSVDFFAAQKPNIEIVGLKNAAQLKSVLEGAAGNKDAFISFYFDGDVGVSIDGNVEYVSQKPRDLFSAGDEYISLADAVGVINDSGLKVAVFDLKTVRHTLSPCGVELKNAGLDALLAAYLVDSNKYYSNIDVLLEYYDMQGIPKACGIHRVTSLLKSKMDELSLNGLYSDIEFPLIDVLFDMENAGFRIDKAVLEELSERYTAELNALKESIYEQSGERFNINSVKQLNAVLYDKLKLPTLKKNKTGYSSTADILAELVDLHPVIALILRYRRFAKLQSTYIDGFRGLISGDGRIHTVFKNALTSTGRLSSVEPNMQNIPVRDAEGREIRRMFIAADGCALLSADYSQIELRLMAHFSGDENLIRAFKDGLDIHTATAAKIFNVSESLVTKEMRRAAKSVNFGIIYGISDFGLSSGLGISVKEAKRFIDKYFEYYPAVKAYMDGNVAYAKANGYIKTAFGRIRFLPEIKSPNFNVRGFNERAAMNMPLQGTAADIIKIAMIRVANEIKREGLSAKLIMTVHDELVVDAPLAEVGAVKRILKREMEGAAALKVPLTVNIEESAQWYH